MAIVGHIEFAVRYADVSCRFYEAALKPLGFERIITVGRDRPDGSIRHGLGRNGRPSLWIHDGDKRQAGLHVAIEVPRPSLVDDFHRAALQAGGADNGPPGMRLRHHAGCYTAQVLDPDGVNVEVVCRASGGGTSAASTRTASAPSRP